MKPDYNYLFKRLSYLFACAIVMIGLLTLIGWQTGIDFLKRPIPHLVAMNPLTASCFVLSAIALIHHSKKSGLPAGFDIVTIIHLFVSIVCGVSVLQTSMHSVFNLDQVLFAERLKADKLLNLSNKMAITTGIAFIAMNTALFLKQRSFHSAMLVSNILSVAVALLSLFSLTGYAYRVDEFYSMLALLPMSLSTAVCFMLLALGTLFQRPELEAFQRITASFISSAVARLLLLASVLVPFVVGLLVLLLHWHANINTELSVALLVLLLIIVFVLLVWTTTTMLVDKEKMRQKIELSLLVKTEELAAANIALQNINQKLEEFVYIASHDLQEPIRKVQMFGNLVKKSVESNEPDKSLEYLRRIDNSALKMRSMIDNLLDYSRILNHDKKAEAVDLDRLLADIIDEYKNSADNQSITMTTGNFEPVAGDAVQLRQAFENLISNAIKFARPETPLQLSILQVKEPSIAKNIIAQPVEQPDNFQFIEVRDNGVGFDQQYAEKMFNMFTRLHADQHIKGTGIGLAVVKKVIENHKGHIAAFGNPGVGAAFVIALPKIPA